jgi:hypothetical protein
MSLLSNQSVTALTTLITTASTEDSKGLHGLVAMQKD